MAKTRYGLAGRESGQGTLEYVLIVVIIVIITLSLLYRFHGAFRVYAQAFFDGYISCLLEVGELPGTGSVCASDMPSFNQANGKMLLKDNLPQPKGGGNGNKGGGKTSAPQSSRETGSGGGSSNAVGRLGGTGRVRSSEVGTVADTNQPGGSGDDRLGVANTHANGRINVSNRGRSVQMDVDSEGRIANKSDDGKPRSAGINKRVDDGGGLRPVKAVENIPRQIASSDDGDQKGFSVGALIRLFIIILIIVAMVIFFGGQLMQISKSREKGGGD